MDPLLSIRDLRIGFHTYDGLLTAVDGVDLDIMPGETLGLVGESGCGKSVTTLSILKLLPKRSTRIEGQINFSGQDLLRVTGRELRDIRGNVISMIFQEPMTSLNPVLTIGRQIEEPIQIHRKFSLADTKKRVLEMLRRVQIPSPETRVRDYPHQLSGGMRQRAMIAMALSCRPRLLLADEPTTALDVTIQAQILDLMLRLKREFGTSILLITHDLGVIAEMASRVVVMYAGQIVEEAEVRSLFKNPLHPYTQGLLGSIPIIGRKFETGHRYLQEIPGVVPSLRELPPGCRFNRRCPKKMDRCMTEAPPLVEKDTARKIRCWLWT